MNKPNFSCQCMCVCAIEKLKSNKQGGYHEVGGGQRKVIPSAAMCINLSDLFDDYTQAT